MEFLADVRDLKFNLFEHLRMQDSVLDRGVYAGLDQPTMEVMLDEAFKLSAEALHPANVPGDEEGCHLVDGVPRVPKAYKPAYRAFCDNGWLSMCHPAEWQGMGMPRVLGTACDELFISSCAALNNYVGLTRAVINMLVEIDDADLNAKWIPNLITGQWQGTMCLTEAGAGSDVGASVTVAEPREDGSFSIKGSKVFITSGDHDMVDNVVHIVLARLPDAAPGTRGLSLFLVPKNRLDGTFNDVSIGSIEHKLGINASCTCVVNFGTADGCIGWMIGKPGEGMKGMFHIMNEERIVVGQQGQALAAAAYQQALSYAKERIQGSDISKGKRASGEKVAIVAHPDVRRNLMNVRAWTEAGRALLLETALLIDQIAVTEDPAEKRALSGRLALLTPICKAWGSDTGFMGCHVAMQVFGGYGYTREYPAEQYLRDSRIASVYEGTNGIQAIDLLFRKAVMADGALVKSQLGEIGAFVEQNKDHARIGGLVARLGAATLELGRVSQHLGQQLAQRALPEAALAATPYLAMFGNVLGAYYLCRQAVVADAALSGRSLPADGPERSAALEDDAEARFYDGKLHTAAFFVHQILSQNLQHAAQITQGDDSALRIVL